jgi:protein associated with RNAse G/E
MLLYNVFPYKKPFTIVDVSLKYLDFDLLLYLFSEDKIEIPEFIEHETIEGITKVDFIEYLNFDKFTNVGSSEFQIKREKLIELIKERQKK